MLKLYMHCGGHHVDREAAVTTPTPQRTRTWVPVPHGRLLGLVEQTLAGAGMRVVSEAHGLWGEGQRYFGLLQVENGRAGLLGADGGADLGRHVRELGGHGLIAGEPQPRPAGSPGRHGGAGAMAVRARAQSWLFITIQFSKLKNLRACAPGDESPKL